MTHKISGIVLTLNEEKHLERCLASIIDCCHTVLVVDSGSSDQTENIARKFGAEFCTNPFVTHAAQINFAINALRGRGGWLMRIDADEILLDSSQAVRDALNGATDLVDGLLVRRRMHFLGKPMRWGGMDPIWQLRIWREGRGSCEQRWMDEHILVKGGVQKTKLRIDDINLNSLTWWTEKHNKYASREAIDILANRHHLSHTESIANTARRDQIAIKRFLKEYVYLKLGPGARALMYFFYRYFFRLGFLDGGPGWYFHVLQGFWYRTLVDAKVAEIEAHSRSNAVPLKEAVRHVTGYEIDNPEWSAKVCCGESDGKSSFASGS